MALNFNARIDEDKTRIEFRDESASIEIVNAGDTSNISGGSNSIYFLLKGQKLVYIGKTDTGMRRHADKDTKINGKETYDRIFIKARNMIQFNIEA